MPYTWINCSYASAIQRHRFVWNWDKPVIFIRRNHQLNLKLDTSNRNDGKQVMQAHAAGGELSER